MKFNNWITRRFKDLSICGKRLFGVNQPESVYFYTFHKCASTLFSRYILKNIRGLQHVDYASQIYQGKLTCFEKVSFEDRGKIYGPLRLSADKMSPVYKELIVPVSKKEFIRNKIAIFFIRDPRDILVSSYYSFGYSHGVSPVEDIKKRQQYIRNSIQKITLNEYVLKSVNGVRENFENLYDLSKKCKRGVILKYEDMIDNYSIFTRQLCKHLEIKNNVIKEIYRRTRPKTVEQKFSHQRSGQTRGYEIKLKTETIDYINLRLDKILTIFEYDK